MLSVHRSPSGTSKTLVYGAYEIPSLPSETGKKFSRFLCAEGKSMAALVALSSTGDAYLSGYFLFGACIEQDYCNLRIRLI